MIVIFDLDYTLLNTNLLKKRLEKIFSRQNFKADYKKYFKDKGVNFDYKRYLDLLKDHKRIDQGEEKKLKLHYANLLKKMNDYLFSGVGRILRDFKKAGAKLILVTFGHKDWQAAKVKNLKIKKYFDIIAYEEKDKAKSKLLKKLNRSRRKVLIINDNAKEIKQMKNILGPEAGIILIDGPYAKNIKHNWPIKPWSKIRVKEYI
jgi:phosphoglycolate phosphatase-like HAD superfamily hydrolase